MKLPLNSQSSASSFVGVGLRKDHYKGIIEGKPKLGFLEVHPENYFGFGPEVELLKKASEVYPISLHGVGLSLGSSSRVSKKHLESLKRLITEINPVMVSEHVSWSMSGNAHLNDLLPVPYTNESLNKLCDNIKYTQDFLERKIMIENPSTYLNFKGEMTEWEYISKAAKRSGCNILLDINNIFVSGHNNKFCPRNYIDSIDANKIGEIHLAGHSIQRIKDVDVRIDTHDDLVLDEVWDLYNYAIDTKGLIPTLIEWDKNLPTLSVLLSEAYKAEKILQNKIIENAA